MNPVSGIYFNLLERKKEELKETIGNRDVNSGGTTSGVTSGAAIATLQEAGNKTGRDAIKTSYRAYVKIIRMVIELVRQFYKTERTFRIVKPNEGEEFVSYSNKGIELQEIKDSNGKALKDSDGEVLKRLPVFDICVKAQKTNPYSKLSQNETAGNLYKMGVFNPENSKQALVMLSMMDFEGKDEIIARVSEGGAYNGKVKKLEEEIGNLKGFIGELRGKGNYSFSQPEKEIEAGIKTPLATAKNGAEKVMSENYGETLVKRANSVKEV